MLSVHEQATIIGTCRLATSWKKISELTGIPKSTVQYTVEQDDKRQNSESLPRPKVKKTTSEQDKALIENVRQTPFQSYQILQETIAPEVSIRTIRRRLADVYLKKWISAERPLLEEHHAAARLAYALEHQNWTLE